MQLQEQRQYFFPGKKHNLILFSMYTMDSINTRVISNSKKIIS